MNVGRLKNKVRNQAATITKLQAYLEMYKGESDDLKVRCEEVDEMLRQTEVKLEIANKEKSDVLDLNEQILKEKQKVEYELVTKNNDIKNYQETIIEMQKARQEAEENRNTYFQGLVKSREEKRELQNRIDYWKEAYNNVCIELDEAKKPWYKKLFK